MKAMVINSFGKSDAFEEASLPTPFASEGEVVIQVKATSVNPVDYKIRDGRIPFLAPSHPTILHPDAAGIITEVGAGVTRFEVGDKVMSFATGLVGKPGALAEYMAADARMIAKMPSNISFEEAAALPLVGVTSWYDILEEGGASPDKSILIMGGTGGVGHIALQLAKWKGAFVAAAVGSDEKAKIATELGADATINYKTAANEDYGKLAPGGQGFDVVFNTPGTPSVNQAVHAAKFGGMIIDILGEFPTEGSFQMKWLSFKSTFAGHEIVFGTNPSRVGEILTELSKLVEEGVVKPLLDPKRFTFRQVGAAHDHAESGSPTGKVVLSQDLAD